MITLRSIEKQICKAKEMIDEYINNPTKIKNMGDIIESFFNLKEKLYKCNIDFLEFNRIQLSNWNMFLDAFLDLQYKIIGDESNEQR